MRSGGGGEGIMHILYTSTKDIWSGSPPSIHCCMYWAALGGPLTLHILRQLEGPHDLSEQHRFLESGALGSES